MKSFCLIMLTILAAVVMAAKPQYDLNQAPQLFEKFIKDYNRHYKDETDKMEHYNAFVRSLEVINESNKRSTTAEFDINQFADYTPEEMKQLTGITIPSRNS